METTFKYLKKWAILNDNDEKSRFAIYLTYENSIVVYSLYKVKSTYNIIYSKKFDNVSKYLSYESIGEICHEMYLETMKRIYDYDKFIDMMEEVHRVEFTDDTN